MSSNFLIAAKVTHDDERVCVLTNRGLSSLNFIMVITFYLLRTFLFFFPFFLFFLIRRAPIYIRLLGMIELTKNDFRSLNADIFL